jgi:ATP-dependent Lhr-like helicase
MQDSLADASLSSGRMSTEATEGATERSHEQATAAYLIVLVESLLDRYGVISPAVVNGESIEGGFSALYPVLRRMEEHGSVVRGMYIQGFGAAQFANADTVNLLRSNGVANGDDRSQAALAEGPGRGSGKPHADSPDARQGIGQDCVVLDTSDPANLYGSALDWPASAVMGGATVPSETVSSEAVPSRQTASEDAAGQVESSGSFKASRRFGSAVVIIDGRAVLYANPKGHRMLLFVGADESDQRQAFAALAAYFQRHAKASITFSQINGKALLSDPAMRAIMQDAAFVPVPQGMRLYR